MDFNLKLSEGQITLIQSAIKHMAEHTMTSISEQVGTHLAALADAAKEKPHEEVPQDS